MNRLDPLLFSLEPEIVIQVTKVFLSYNIKSSIYEQVVKRSIEGLFNVLGETT